MRDRLAHRGPDDAGLWAADGAILGHRRLSIIDPRPAGHQPMATPDGRYVIVYNGELYNDAEVRAQLSELGVRFNTECDTETVLRAVATWGAGGVETAGKLRGMYALAVWDTQARTLLLGRDALGIKPLYWTMPSDRELAFASEIPALLEHPGVRKAPDMATVSAYLTTIRTTLGERTMYAGVSTLRPGEWMLVDAAGAVIERKTLDVPRWPAAATREATRDAVVESVRLHQRSDVPLCSLLSGGLDSTIIAACIRDQGTPLTTFCAGADQSLDDSTSDFAHARLAADALGTEHVEVPIGSEDFLDGWKQLISHNAVPMSTPNELAIFRVAQRVRSRGYTVTLTGEGADELFCGYHMLLDAAAGSITSDSNSHGGEVALRSASWIAPENKAQVLTGEAYAAAGHDRLLIAHYQSSYDRCLYEARLDHPEADEASARLDAHARLLQAINLDGLLRRLDTSTMAASVEGRTPLADPVILRHAGLLPLDQKYTPPGEDGSPSGTKLALRRAFVDRVPVAITHRPKASFPLPFETWMVPAIPGTPGSTVAGWGWAEQICRPEVLAAVSAAPGNFWHLAWPLINLKQWGDSVF